MKEVPTRPKRRYQRYWDLVKVTGHLVITMDQPNAQRRYIKAIKKEKLADPKYRYSGFLRFSYFESTLVVRYIQYKASGALSNIPESSDE